MILNWYQKIKSRWQGLSPRQKTGVVFLVCLAFFGSLYLLTVAEPALAQGAKEAAAFVKDPATYTANGLVQFATRIMMWLATFFMRLAIFFMKFLLEVAGYNGYLDSTAVNIGWVMVRDISNMFFVVILLLIAFGTILGIEQYEWKKLLIKFVFAAVLVNFSRVICALIIDAAQVVMITFLNGVAATAGGNLINAFKLDKLLSFNANLQPTDLDNTQVFLAGVAAVWFAAMTAAVMAGYVMLMAARLVMLWILIVLSPLAFLLNVLPQTQKYASQWWTEFGNHVVVGPILAFFLWLSFVTVGSGNVHDEISENNNYAITEEAIETGTTLSVAQQTATGVSEIMKWTSMAGFFIAIGMLFAGIKITMSLNTIGGAMFGKAVEYGKKAAMIGTGAAAGLWLGRKGVEGGKVAAKWGLMNMPFGGKFWSRQGRTIAGAAGLYWGKGEEWRNKLAEQWQKKGGRIGKVPGLRWAASVLVESQRRAEKRVKKVATAKEQQDEMVEAASVKGSWQDAVGIAQAGKHEEFERYRAAKKERKVSLRQAEQKKAAADVTEARAELLEAQEGGNPAEVEAAQQNLKAAQAAARKLQGAQAYGGVPLGEIIEQEKRGAEIGKAEAMEKEAALKTRGLELKEGMPFGIGVTKYAGEEMYKAKAKGTLADEGIKREEESKLLEAQFNLTRDEDGKYKEFRSEIENKYLAAQGGKALIDGGRSNAQQLRETASQKVQEAGKKREEAKEANKEAQKYEDEFQKAAPGPVKQEMGRRREEYATRRDTLLGEAKKLDEEAGENNKAADAEDARTAAPTVNVDKLEEVLEKLSEAIEKGGPEKENIIKDLNQGDNLAALKMMFGSQVNAKAAADHKNLAALKSIQETLAKKKSELAGKSGMALRSGFETATTGNIETQRDGAKKALEDLTRKQKTKMPSVFSANSSALRDHNYALYRGLKADSVSNASQALVWDKHGIETPSNAGAEMVGEEFYAKVFKDMNYEQVLQASSNFMAKAKRPGYKATYEDKAIGQAILYKLKDQAWMDDQGDKMAAQGTTKSIIVQMRGTVFQGDEGNFDRIVNRAEQRQANTVPKLDLSGLEQAGQFIKNAFGGNAQNISKGIKNKDQTVIHQLEQQIGPALRQDLSMGSLGLNNVAKLIKTLQSLGDADFSTLLAKM